MSKKKQKPITVCCVKVGTKYDTKYVNILYAMVRRNLTIPFEFVCITDDPEGINPEIRTVEPIYNNYWWTKLTIFAKDAYNFAEKVLYFDLDVVIVSNINKLATYDSNFAICRDWLISKYNSSVMLFNSGEYSHVWEKFDADKEAAIKLCKDGDQGWIGRNVDADLFPERWISSYKVHVRNIGEPTSKIVLFHGKPDPDEVDHQWVKENWRE